MRVFVKAIITGFGLSLGAALYNKVAKRLGFDERDRAADTVTTRDGATDPGLQKS